MREGEEGEQKKWEEKKQKMKKGEGKCKTLWLGFFISKQFSRLSFLERGMKISFS